MAAAVRGGDVRGVIFHSDKGSEFTADLFAAVCDRLGVVQSAGRVGSCFDNAAIESWHSTLEFELLSRRRFATKAEATTRGGPLHRPLQHHAAPQQL